VRHGAERRRPRFHGSVGGEHATTENKERTARTNARGSGEFSSEQIRRASALHRAGGSGWLPTAEGVQQNRQQRVHAAKRRARGYQSIMKTTGHQPREN